MNRVDHQDTKIVATIGPASNSYETILALVEAGVDVFRLNFSHGSHDDHLKVIQNIKYLNKKYRLHIGIMADLQGPKIRIGEVPNGSIDIKPGDELTFVTRKNEEGLLINYSSFPEDVKVGERILLDDGKIILTVLETNGKDRVRLEVVFGGKLSSNKGVNLPDTRVSLPSLTEKDMKDLDFILSQPVNWIALSFVRSPRDLKKLGKIIEERGHPAKIIAKIEKPQAVNKINKIIKHSNGIMIARGDLGVEMPMEKLPGIQKEIIKKCVQRARPVIVATQMMESMIENPSPTRAEITDVANAVIDGADAVMLSAETAMGKHPVRVVDAMNRIIDEAEKSYVARNLYHSTSPKSTTFASDIVCFNSARVSEELKARAIVGMTVSGYTAFKISSCRPSANIYIFSENMDILATLNLVWGVRCYYYDKMTTTDGTIEDVNNILKEEDRIKKGDYVINTGSMPISERKRTNMLKVTTVE